MANGAGAGPVMAIMPSKRMFASMVMVLAFLPPLAWIEMLPIFARGYVVVLPLSVTSTRVGSAAFRARLIVLPVVRSPLICKVGSARRAAVAFGSDHRPRP